MKRKTYWVVDGSDSGVRHDSLLSAETEARGLVEKHPGMMFDVLASVSTISMTGVVREDHEMSGLLMSGPVSVSICGELAGASSKPVTISDKMINPNSGNQNMKAPMKAPTAIGKIWYPESSPPGYYNANENMSPCTCMAWCQDPCKGSCGCKACSEAYGDCLSSQGD